MGDKKVPERIHIALNRWDKQSAFLQYGYMGLVVAGAASSFLVPVFVGIVDEMVIRVLSAVSGFSITLISAFSLKEKSNEMRAAFNKLRASLIKYEHHENYTLGDLVTDFSAISDGLSDIKGEGIKPESKRLSEQT